LARVGGRYSDEWHRAHLENPRDLVPESNMPAYPWLTRTMLNPKDIDPKLRVLRTLGTPYTDADLAGAQDELKDKTEQDALIAYLQMLGTAIKSKN
jgi:cytochrome c oxidase cbb3-type subunit 2